MYASFVFSNGRPESQTLSSLGFFFLRVRRPLQSAEDSPNTSKHFQTVWINKTRSSRGSLRSERRVPRLNQLIWRIVRSNKFGYPASIIHSSDLPADRLHWLSRLNLNEASLKSSSMDLLSEAFQWSYSAKLLRKARWSSVVSMRFRDLTVLWVQGLHKPRSPQVVRKFIQHFVIIFKIAFNLWHL